MSELNPQQSRFSDFLKNPSKALWTLATPIMVGMLAQTLYSVVDMMFIGRLGGDAIAAVAFNMPLFFLVLGVTVGIGSGVTASIARFVGAKQKSNADNSAEHALFLGIIISGILTTLGLLYGRNVLSLIGAPDSLVDLSWLYLRINVLGIPFLVLSILFRSIMSGEGDTKSPMIVEGSGTILNIILDPIFIFALGFGVPGAAMASVISRGIVFFVFVYMLFFKKHTYITFNLKDFSLSGSILADIVKVGFPASVSMVVMSIGQLSFNKILVHFSTDTVAAYQIGGRLDMIVFMPILSIAVGMTTLVGMFYGANEPQKVRWIIRYGIQRSFMITALLSIAIYSFAPVIVKGFSSDAFIQATAVRYIRLMTLIYPLVSIGLTSGRILQGFGLGFPMLVITLVRVLIVAVPLALVFVFVYEKPVEWVWYSMMTSAGLSMFVSLGWLKYAFGRFLTVVSSVGKE
ncbi:MAG: MATE family efflux transporter [Candidatus Marinimicrobia bacterium]|jgi:putative MATE family efflux protein|nr:MATE family efflux transporter [Candidatus Neomarinimicrobiota bacterium]MDP6789340.1 MATE family efflux transporter [Candidatus Neomarinimicrobiota bacterium]